MAVSRLVSVAGGLQSPAGWHKDSEVWSQICGLLAV